MLTPKIFRNWSNYSKASRRAKNMSKGDLIDYMDSSLSDIGRNLDNYRRQPSWSSSVMLKEASLALAVMASELHRKRTK